MQAKKETKEANKQKRCFFHALYFHFDGGNSGTGSKKYTLLINLTGDSIDTDSDTNTDCTRQVNMNFCSLFFLLFFTYSHIFPFHPIFILLL